MPTGNRKNTASHRRTCRRRYGNHHRINSHPPANLTFRVNIPQLRRIHTRNGGSAEPLENTCHRQRPERIGQRANQRSDTKQPDARKKDFPITNHLSQSGKGQQGYDDCQLIAIDNPRSHGRRRPEVQCESVGNTILTILMSSTDMQRANPTDTTAQIRLGIGNPSDSSDIL